MSDMSSRRDSNSQAAPLHATPEDDGTLVEAKGKPHKISLYDRYILDSWWLEFLAWLLAAVMLMALLILLGEFNGKALSEWHSELTLNTIIAVLSQLVQMLLLVPITSSLSQLQWLWYRNKKPLKDMAYFHDASTGLIDGLILVYKCHTSLFVWLGIISTILQALFGAFAQQALSLPIRQISIGPPGTISRSLIYNTPLGSEQIENVTPPPPEVVPEMKLAIYTGLLRDRVNPSEVQGNCITGNCTFGVFASMGVCTSVEDVTPSILTDCKNTEHFSGISDDKCSYTVPALRNSPPFSNVRTHAGEPVHSTLYMGAGKIDVDPEITDTSQTPISGTLIEFYIIYVPDLTILPQKEGKTSYTGKLAALKGTLSLCAHNYNSSMQFGVTNTVLQSQETSLTWRHGNAANINNLTGYVASVPRTHETLFMNPASLNGLSIWLITSVFNGTATMLPPPTANGQDPAHPSAVTNNAPAIFSTLASKQVVTHLYGNETGVKVTDGVGALRALLDNVAMSMSNGLRTTSTAPASQTGAASTMEIYFQVTWPWLIVPILSILLTLLLLVLTIRRSRRHNIPPWKSSQLAALQALNPGIRARLGDGLAKNSELEEMVRREGVHVRLRRGAAGRWELGEDDR